MTRKSFYTILRFVVVIVVVVVVMVVNIIAVAGAEAFALLRYVLLCSAALSCLKHNYAQIFMKHKSVAQHSQVNKEEKQTKRLFQKRKITDRLTMDNN